METWIHKLNWFPCGEELVGHLDRLFSRFGAPLFCKRDNGGNLNHAAADQALSEAMVFPIKSPVYTASYNEAIEHTQGYFKGYPKRWQWKAKFLRQCVLLAETAAHDINHRPRRRCLDGKTACRAYFGNGRLHYPKRKRESVYHWIPNLAERISIGLGKNVVFDSKVEQDLSAGQMQGGRLWQCSGALFQQIGDVFSRKGILGDIRL